ncbi:MAG TPA: hypothetical protein VL486_15840 [Verrucomicrobiae bacterium]|nr:hypothetical protein [Verrucomicrobiae bacterium]
MKYGRFGQLPVWQDGLTLAESISRQLRAGAGNLQNSPITGQRDPSEKSCKLDEPKKRAEAFLQKLRQTAAGRAEN